jgi:peptidyl-prolyl cis-trans isomerase C
MFHGPYLNVLRARHGKAVAGNLVVPVLLFSVLLTACAAKTPLAPSAPPAPSATPGPPTATPVPFAALVNGEGIPLAEWDSQVTEYIAAQQALGKTVTEDEGSQAVLEDMIAQMLLAQGARAAGFELSESALDERIAALAEEVGGPDKLTEWEAAHGYTEDSFRVALKRAAEAAFMRDKIVTAVPKTADQVRVQQILLYNENDAIRISNELKAGIDFDAMAALIDPDTRGELSWFPSGYLLEPEIEQAAFLMQVGDVSEVIPTKVGYHIIKVLGRDPERVLSPDAYLAEQERALKDWVEQQRAAATIVMAP